MRPDGCRWHAPRWHWLSHGLCIRLFLYEFYLKGSFLQDAGWFAFLMSEGGVALRDPLALGAHSFLGTHISPIFLLSGLFRRGLPVSDPQFFCGAMALFHALPAAAVLRSLRTGIGLRIPVATVLAALVAVSSGGRPDNPWRALCWPIENELGLAGDARP